mmetsp:Transcript_113886/g.362083  ORF Transcript_113886/g.362083 Transcript_113886/m.362083 type:complete len:215 (-) Transcript_113886:2147-2791(-)
MGSSASPSSRTACCADFGRAPTFLTTRRSAGAPAAVLAEAAASEGASWSRSGGSATFGLATAFFTTLLAAGADTPTEAGSVTASAVAGAASRRGAGAADADLGRTTVFLTTRRLAGVSATAAPTASSSSCSGASGTAEPPEGSTSEANVRATVLFMTLRTSVPWLVAVLAMGSPCRSGAGCCSTDFGRVATFLTTVRTTGRWEVVATSETKSSA